MSASTKKNLPVVGQLKHFQYAFCKFAVCSGMFYNFLIEIFVLILYICIIKLYKHFPKIFQLATARLVSIELIFFQLITASILDRKRSTKAYTVSILCVLGVFYHRTNLVRVSKCSSRLKNPHSVWEKLIF